MRFVAKTLKSLNQDSFPAACWRIVYDMSIHSVWHTPGVALFMSNLLCLQSGKTKFSVENATKTRIVLADTRVHILGSFQNIRAARWDIFTSQASSENYYCPSNQNDGRHISHNCCIIVRIGHQDIDIEHNAPKWLDPRVRLCCVLFMNMFCLVGFSDQV